MWEFTEKAESGWFLEQMAEAETTDRLPRYKRLIQLIEHALEDGRLASGEKLPPERELALRLGLNRSTVVRALDELAERGLLLRKKGSGTYVNPEKWGLQSHQLFNWQAPPALRRQKSGSPWAAYQRQIEALRHRAKENRAGKNRSGESWNSQPETGRKTAKAQRGPLDLSGDSLPPGLLPDLFLGNLNGGEGGGFSLGQLVSAEQGEESALLGLPRLRRAVRGFLREQSGLHLPPDQILITSGTQQALFLVTQCLLRPGDAVGVEFPSYFYSLPVFQAAGLRLYALPMDEEGITLEGLDAQYQTRRLKMIFLNPMFHNPTGSCMSPARKAEVLRYCSLKHIPIFEDDAYSLLAFDPALDTSPIKAQDKHHQIIYCGSLSSYAGRNLRAGWMAAPEPVIRRLAWVRLQMDSGLSVLPQLMAAQYLEQGFAPHRLRLWQCLPGRAAALAARLREIAGEQSKEKGGKLDFTQPQGGLYLYARQGEAGPPLKKRSGKNKNDLLAALLQRGIIPAPGLNFGENAQTFRFNFACFA